MESISIGYDLFSKLFSVFLKKHIYVREIRDPESYDAKQFMELYYKMIPQNLQISAAIILDFVGNQKYCDIVHHLFVCKRNDKVVGFIKIMICERLRYLFIAYLGIDQGDFYAKSKGMYKLLKKVVNRYSKKMKLNIIAEISNTPMKNLAMRSLIRRYSKEFGRISYTIDADYLQPKMPDTKNESDNEEFLTLLYIPFLRLSNNIVSKDELCAIISSIYYDIYAPSCSIINGCDPQEYNKYLGEILKLLKESYDNIIKLTPC